MNSEIKRVTWGTLFFFFVFFPFFSVLSQNSKDVSFRDVSPDPKFKFPSDSMIRFSLISLPPEKKSSGNDLLNDCFYCFKENRLWYQFQEDLLRAIQVCGYDYIESRMDAAFLSGTTKAYLLAHGRFDTSLNFTLDSIEVTITQDTSTKKHLVFYNFSVTAKKNLRLSTESVPDIMNKDRFVREIFNRISKNSFVFEMNGSSEKFNIAIAIAGSTYLVNHLGMYTLEKDKGMPLQNGSPGRASFRVGLYGEEYPCVAKCKDCRPDVRKFSVRYFMNQLIADLHVKSNEGIAQIIFSTGNYLQVFKYNGETEMQSAIPLTINDSNTILQMNVIDRKGNSTIVIRSIYESKISDKKKKEESIALNQKRDAWTQKSGVHRTIGVISRLQGNPISWVLNKMIKKNALVEYLSEPDFVNADSFTSILLPTRQRIPSLQTDSMVFIRSQLFHAETISSNGARYMYLGGVTLKKTGSTVGMTHRSVYGNGNYRCIWTPQCDTGINTDKDLFIMCKKSSYEKENLQLSGIPHTFPSPLDQIGYSLVSMFQPTESDTIIYTYVLWYTDKTKETVFRELPLSGEGKIKFQKGDYTSVTIRGYDECYLTPNEKIMISRETLVTKKALFRVDVFAYSCKKNSTFGTGSAWLCR